LLQLAAVATAAIVGSQHLAYGTAGLRELRLLDQFLVIGFGPAGTETEIGARQEHRRNHETEDYSEFLEHATPSVDISPV
jgi:hypothetical protein